MSAEFTISIVVPFYDEEENVVPVLSEIQRFFPDAELIAVDDGSSDGTARALAGFSGVQAIRLPRHLGKSAAIYRGLVQASGEVCVLMDGDGQSNTADIKLLLKYFPDYDFVNGCRVKRHDDLNRVIVSKLGNAIRSLFTHDGFRDTNGTPKAMKRECVPHLIPFEGLHRFIPAFLARAGFRVLEVPVAHRERLHGRTKYTNAGRTLRGAWDLIGVSWLLNRRIDARALELRVSSDGHPETGNLSPD